MAFFHIVFDWDRILVVSVAENYIPYSAAGNIRNYNIFCNCASPGGLDICCGESFLYSLLVYI